MMQSLTAVDQHPPQRKSILRYFRSASNFQQRVCGNNAEAPCLATDTEDHPVGERERKTTALVKGVSGQAE
jgi:hypothetical protein